MEYYFETATTIPSAKFSHIEKEHSPFQRINSFSSGFCDSQLTLQQPLIKICDSDLYDFPLDL